MGKFEPNETTNPVLIDIPVPIETPRLILRPPQPGDGAALHAAKMESWDLLARWMPWAKEKSSAAEDEAVLREAYAKFILREDLMMLGFDRASGTFIASCGLHRFDWQIRHFEIGYWVRKSAQNKGYATEIAHALTRFAFGALEARTVTIGVAAGNEASIAVTRKLGFAPVGVQPLDLLLPGGDVVDRHIFTRTDLKGLPPLDVRWGMP